MMKALIGLIAILWLVATMVEVATAQVVDEVVDTDTLITLDTMYVVEVTAPRAPQNTEPFTIRDAGHTPAGPWAAAIGRSGLVAPNRRQWVWAAVGAGAAVATYVWLAGERSGRAQQGTLRVTIDGMPE